MKSRDDRKRDFDGEEDGDDDDEHHGRRVGVPLPPIPTLFRKTKDGHPPADKEGWKIKDILWDLPDQTETNIKPAKVLGLNLRGCEY